MTIESYRFFIETLFKFGVLINFWLIYKSVRLTNTLMIDIYKQLLDRRFGIIKEEFKESMEKLKEKHEHLR